jgi:hypothetical protein
MLLGLAFAPVPSGRSVRGRVVNNAGAPISGAIVYLNDLNTKTVTSYITPADGHYGFQQLSPNDDYKVWAKFEGKESPTKTISSFDNRETFHVTLQIESQREAAKE